MPEDYPLKAGKTLKIPGEAAEKSMFAKAQAWRSSRLGKSLLVLLLLLIISPIFLVPFLWMGLGSLRPSRDLFSHLYPFSWNTLFPVTWTLSGYQKLFDSDFERNLLNSFTVAAIQVPVAILFDSMAAFALAWLPLPRRNLVFGLVLVMLAIPIDAIMIPMYLVVVALNLQNSLPALFLPWISQAFGIFLFRQFFLELPQELVDAAIIDGARPHQIYWHIMLPNVKPAIVTTGLIYFMWSWNAFFWPLIAVQDRKLQVVQVAAATFINPEYTDWTVLFAAATVATLPVIIIFLLLQRYYIRGIATTGIKG